MVGHLFDNRGLSCPGDRGWGAQTPSCIHHYTSGKCKYVEDPQICLNTSGMSQAPRIASGPKGSVSNRHGRIQCNPYVHARAHLRTGLDKHYILSAEKGAFGSYSTSIYLHKPYTRAADFSRLDQALARRLRARGTQYKYTY
jgi:hypothetical protein